jgi:hypothetical protein
VHHPNANSSEQSLTHHKIFTSGVSVCGLIPAWP